MGQRKTSPHLLEIGLFVLILFAGIVLRFSALSQSPAGLTAVEEAAVANVFRLADTEPTWLFNADNGISGTFFYYAAGFMIEVTGQPAMGRIAAAAGGVILLLEVYLWIRLATQNHPLALASMAGLVVSFWGVMVSRLITSAGWFPVLFMGAALAMRRGFKLEEDIEDVMLPLKYRPTAVMEGWWWFLLAGILLGVSLYTYPPARLMWFVFPAFFILLSLDQPGVIRRIWPGLALMLLIALIIALPLARSLATNPEILYISRIADLLSEALTGNPTPLRHSLRSMVGLLTVRGDPMAATNIPGKPILGPMMSLLFYIGASIALVSYAYPYRPSQHGVRTYDESFRVVSSNIFMLLVLVGGLLPAVLSGLEYSMLNAVGALPALYYFPALAIQWMADNARKNVGPDGAKALWVTYGFGLIIILGITVHAYFTVWAGL